VLAKLYVRIQDNEAISLSGNTSSFRGGVNGSSSSFASSYSFPDCFFSLAAIISTPESSNPSISSFSFS